MYHVALAEFVQPGIIQETPPPPQPPPAPDPIPEPPQEPEPKVIGTIKPTPPVRVRPAPKPAPPVAQPSAQPKSEPSSTPVPVASGQRPRQFGGLSAYDQDHVDQRPSISRRVAANKAYDDTWEAAISLFSEVESGSLSVEEALGKLPGLSWS